MNSEPRQQVLRFSLLLAVVAAATVAVAMVIVSWGAKDAPVIGGALGAAGTFVGELVAVGTALHPAGEKGVNRNESPRSIPWKWIVPIAVLVVCVAAVPGYWYGIHRPDVPVTDRMTQALGGRGSGLSDGSAVELEVPGRPPGRNSLALTLKVVNKGPAGNCESPARMRIDPSVDGVQQPSTTARTGREVKIPLADVTRTALLRITLAEHDPECKVDLSVTEATLFN